MTDTAVELQFADGSYRFWLPMPQLIELERVCGQGGQPKSIFTIYDQLGAGLGRTAEDAPVYLGGGAAIASDAREVIRLAGIGGGKALVDGVEKEIGPLTMRALIEAYVYPARPLIEAVNVAWTICHAAINGIDLKKKAADEAPPEKPKRSRKARSSPTAAPSA